MSVPVACPRCRKSFDLHGSSLPQHLGAFVQGRASGVNVIHQQDAFISDFLWSTETESPSQIAASFCAVKLGLRHSIPVPLEQVRLNFPSPSRKAGFGQEQRLIEAPPAQAADVQRHRQDQIRFVEQGRSIRLFGQGGKAAQASQTAAELELMNERPDRLLISSKGTRLIKGEGVLLAVPAAMSCARCAAAGTERAGNQENFSPAVLAEQGRTAGAELSAAAQTAGRKEQLGKGGKERVKVKGEDFLPLWNIRPALLPAGSHPAWPKTPGCSTTPDFC